MENERALYLQFCPPRSLAARRNVYKRWFSRYIGGGASEAPLRGQRTFKKARCE